MVRSGFATEIYWSAKRNFREERERERERTLGVLLKVLESKVERVE